MTPFEIVAVVLLVVSVAGAIRAAVARSAELAVAFALLAVVFAYLAGWLK